MEFLDPQDNNMAKNITFPDSIIFDPVTSGYYDTEVGDLGNVTPAGGRLMNRPAHVDGLYIANASQLQSSSTNLVLTRNGKGDWSLNRTAAGAETYNVRVPIGTLLRIGETYNYGDFSPGPSAGAKGIKCIDFFVTWNIGVVALTSATLRMGTDVYPILGAAAAAPVVTDIVAATALTPLTATGAGLYITQGVAVLSTSQVFFTADDSIGEIELNLVMANTGTVAIANIGMHCHLNYT
jgi:hypothetical protein